MADIKTKVRGTVRTLNKTVNTSNRIKTNIVSTKDKLENISNPEESNVSEYAINKISNSIYIGGNKSINSFNKYGQNAVKKSYENIDKGIERIKAFKNKIAKGKEKQVLEQKAKNSIKTLKNVDKLSNSKYIKSSNETNVKAIKTSKNVELKIENSSKMAKQTVQKIKVVTENGFKTAKNSMKALFRTIKMMLIAAQNLNMFIIAGCWIVVMIIIVICMIGFLTTSIFGIFFTNEYYANSKNMVQVISELNTDFVNKITTIQQENPYDEYDITGSRSEWKDILAVYVAKYSNEDYNTEMMSLDEKKIEEIKKIFWDMNEVTFTKDIELHQELRVVGNKTQYVTVTRSKLHITIMGKSIDDMVNIYNFNQKQKEQLAELLKDDYINMWTSVIYGSTGSSDIVSVAQNQVGNIGGQTYWSWYGFNSRVEWCACFVSWCANECGYIENGIIPKFAACESEGVAWFKACGLWQDGGYIPKPGDIIFFDWADKHDGSADHVGIVEKVENGRVYTIEGNSNDLCQEKNYDINSTEIQGYGTPMY